LNKQSIDQALGTNAYPGRGIILGKSEDDHYAVIAYFIMGRSENSRNRIFVEDGTGIRTQAFDPAKLSDPSLIIYSPVRALDHMTVVTNGDQTDTVCEYLTQGRTFEEALRTRTFEPDAPNFTPRISGLVETGGKFRYRLSILKSGDGEGKTVERFFFDYNAPAAGEGHLIQTYLGDASPLPSFEGEPVLLSLEGSIDGFTHAVWDSLNEDNKISLFTRFINLKTGLIETRILNKNYCSKNS
jgi:IMP cyclohydrolase